MTAFLDSPAIQARSALSASPYKKKLVLLGDSLLNNGQDPGYTVTSTASIASNLRGWWHWLQAMAGHPFKHEIGWNDAAVAAPYRIGHNWGKGSDDTQDLLDRQTEWLAVIDSDTLVICDSITNDATSFTVAQFMTNVAAIHELIAAKGAHLVWTGLSERNQVDAGGTAYWTTSARHHTAHAMDNALREYCNQHTDIDYFDILTGFVDAATGDLISGRTADGLHFNQRHAYKQALKFLGDFPALIPPPKSLHAKSLFAVYDGTSNVYGNLISNGTMTGTGGTTSGNNMSGTWADTWQAYMPTPGGLSVAGSIVTDSTPNALRWQRMTFTSGTTADGSGAATFRLRWNSGTNITTGVVAGEWYKFAFLLRFTAPTVAGVRPIDSFYAMLEDKHASGWDTRWGASFTNAGDKGMPEENTDILYCESQPIQAVDATGLDFDFFFVGGSASASSVTVDVTGVNIFRMRTAPTFT